MKENDYFLNLLNNPTFNPFDFKNVGFTTDNTSIEKADTYKNLEYIQQNPMFQTDGKFDGAKFNQIYNAALESYNVFANNEASEAIAKEQSYFRNDIFVDPEERYKGYESEIYRAANPTRQRMGLIYHNDVQESPLSVREIAQTQKVWDPQTQTWQDAPNDSWIDNWTNTRVLAQWDEDGEHKDPFTGQMVKHKKGEKKINENGTYYYENLNGRDVYGREVLSKFDTLTRDGSLANQFDFFDSDDKEKSVFGNIMKNAIKVIPAFIPGVNSWYIGARVGMNVVELLSKSAKMFAGTENKTLNDIEGYIDSLGFSVSDYAQGSSEANIPAHVWSMENFLNMGADTFLQLAEQRWIFKMAPSLFMGKAGYSEKAKKDFLENELTKRAEKYNFKERVDELAKQANKSEEKLKKAAQAITDSKTLNILYAQSMYDKYTKSYNNIGKFISQAYMTGITTKDAYAQAKADGASDTEAALFTLGYALGEYAIINSDLGKWILPELKMERMAIKQKLKLLGPQPEKNASPSQKMNWVKKVIGLGRDVADNTYNYYGTNLAKTITAGALSEGMEEVSEELWYDVAKGLFNASTYITGSDAEFTAFDNIADRYGMSFVGGMLGGTIASAQTDFKTLRSMKELDKDQAFQAFVHDIKEGKAADYRKIIKKHTWGSQDLSAYESIDDFGYKKYFKGSSGKDQDTAIKQQFNELIDITEKILNTNGAKVDDESLMNTLVGADRDFRYLALKNSTFMANYLQEFNTLAVKIVDVSNQLYKLQNPDVADSAKKEAIEQNSGEIQKLTAELKNLIEQKDEFLKGNRTGEYIEKALFEMSEDISSIFIDTNRIAWIENIEGKKINEIAPDRLKVLEQQWKDWSQYERKDKLEIAFRIFKKLNLTSSALLQSYDQTYFGKDLKDNSINAISNVFQAQQRALLNSEIQGDAFLNLAAEGAGEHFNSPTSRYYQFANILISKSTRQEELSAKLIEISQLENKAEQEAETIDMIVELLQDENVVAQLNSDIDQLPYMSFADRNMIKSVIDIRDKFVSVNAGVELGAFYPEAAEAIQGLINKINEKPYSPVLELINKWSTSLGNTDVSPEKLLNTLEVQHMTLAPNKNLKDFSIGEDDGKRIATILNNIKLLKATILAARTDGVTTSNRVGYNVTSNELLKTGLAEIDKNNANVILQDITKVESRLKFYAKIHEVNTGQKLYEHEKVQVNRDIIVYQKLNKLVTEHDWPPKEWNSANELREVLSNLEIVPTLGKNVKDRRLTLDSEEKVLLRKDMQKLDNALYTFFQNNKDYLNDPKKLSELFSDTLFNFISDEKPILNRNTDHISDSQFVWWLATRAAMNPEAFYSIYKQSFINGIAPIASQEQAIMTAIASLLNGQIFHNFAKAYNISLAAQVERTDDTQLDKYNRENYRSITKDWLDSDVAINFFRHILIEGIAGSGKTSAVAKTIVAILNKSDKGKELLKNVWFVHTTKEEALNWAKSLGYDEKYENVYSREEYLEKIAPGVSKHRIIKDDALQVDPKSLIQREGETLYRYNIEINKGYSDNIPSLIMMDEVTGFSQQDMLLSEDFANYYGTMNLVFGDFDQDGLEGDAKLSDGTYFKSQIFAGNFMSASKLGNSMRTANVLKDSNNKDLRAVIHDLEFTPREKATNIVLDFKWYTDGTEANNYQDQTTLVGDKIYKDYGDIEGLKRDIETLLKNVPENEKLGYVYDDKESPIYQWLYQLNQDGQYKSKIDFKEGSSSQGREADYYVVDLTYPSKDVKKHSKFWRQTYTGFTRARKGTVAIIQGTDNINRYSTPQESISEFFLPPNVIKEFSDKQKKVFDEVYTGTEQLEYIPFKGSRKVNQVMVNGKMYNIAPRPDNLNIGNTFMWENNTHTVKGFVTDGSKTYIWTNSDSDNLYELNDFINNILPNVNQQSLNDETFEEEQKAREKINNKNKTEPDIVNDNDDELNMLLHSFATNETGIIEENGKYKVSYGYESRVDSLNGLIKLFGINVDKNGYISKEDYDYLQKQLQQVRSAVLYGKSKTEIINAIKNIALSKLGTTNIHVKLAFKSHYMPGKNPNVNEEEEFIKTKGKFAKWYKSIKERLVGMFRKDRSEPTQKTISMIVTKIEGNKEVAFLEVPLVNFTNPLTMLTTKGFEKIKELSDQIVQDLDTEGKKYTSKDVLEKLVNQLETTPVKMSKPFVKLSKVYLNYYQNSIVLLDDIIADKYNKQDNEITLSNIFDSTGIIVTNIEKGSHEIYYREDLNYDGEWIPITDYKKESGKVVSDIMATTSDILDSNNNIVIEAGHPFVLVTDAMYKFAGRPDNDLIDAYLEQLKNPNAQKLIKPIFVAPPTSSMYEYFENLDAVYRRNKEVDSTIGTTNTAFNILYELLANDVLSDHYGKFSQYYLPLKEMVQKIYDEKQKLTSKDFIDLIQSTGEIAGESLQTFSQRVYGHATYAKSWKALLQRELRSLLFDDALGKPTLGVQNNEKIEKAIAHLATKNINGIFYHPSLDPDKPQHKGFQAINNFEGTFKGKPFMINGKLDSQAFKGNVLPILDALVNALTELDEKGKSKSEKDFMTYNGDNYIIYAPNPTYKKQKEVEEQNKCNNLIKSYKDQLFKSNSEVEDIITKEVNKNSNLTIDQLKQVLINKKYFVRTLEDGRLYTSKLGKNIKYIDENTIEKDGVKYIFQSVNSENGLDFAPEQTEKSDVPKLLKNLSELD